MAGKITGYSIAILCFLGFAFLINYHGNLMSHPALWAILLLIIGAFALYIGFTSKSGKVVKQETDAKEKITRLKQSGKKILLSLDDCEIKENNYYEEVVKKTSRAQSIDSLVDPNANYEEKEVDQSVIIYYYKQGTAKYKIISQVFNHDAVSLSAHIENKQVALYINPDDVKDYIFELADE